MWKLDVCPLIGHKNVYNARILESGFIVYKIGCVDRVDTVFWHQNKHGVYITWHFFLTSFKLTYSCSICSYKKNPIFWNNIQEYVRIKVYFSILKLTSICESTRKATVERSLNSVKKHMLQFSDFLS